MSWLSPLLNPVIDRLIDRLATKLAEKIEMELEAAVDAALDQTEMRIRELLKSSETRLLAAAGQGIATVPGIELQQGLPTRDGTAVAAEEIRAMLRRQAKAAGPGPVAQEVPDR